MRRWLIEKLGGFENADRAIASLHSEDVADERRDEVIVSLGGFPTVESALDHIRAMDDKEAKRDVLRLAVQDLFMAINPDDILKINADGTATFLGKMLSSEQVKALVLEANTLRSMKLWSVLKWDMRHQLSRKMYEEGRVAEDFVWGQLATWLFDVFKTRLDQLAKMGKTLK
jgi:hypothetical protein